MARATTTITAAAMIVAQLLPTLPAAAQVHGGYPGGWQGANSQLIRCESVGGRYQECAVPFGAQRVELARQLSNQPCIEGRSWGQRGQASVWVSDGCRAEFALVGAGQGGYPGGAYPGTGYPGTAYPGASYPGAGYPGVRPGQSYAQRVNCASRGAREAFCPVDTRGGVELIRVNRGECVPQRDWTFDAQGIRVRNNCRAVFGVGYAGGYPGGGYPGNTYPGTTYPGGGYPGNTYPGGAQGGFAGTRDCESRDYRPATCAVNTQGRVQLLRLEGGQCEQGRDWSFDDRAIYVRNGCRARFGYGYGNETGSGGGIGAGGLIAGAAVAAGLIALLASRGKRAEPNASNAASATLLGNDALFPAEARTDGRACLNEAARQVGATGGSRVTLERVNDVRRDGGGYRIAASLAAVYDGRIQPLTMTCTAANGRVSAFDVR